jgi:P-type Ca2+ transporter type 2C
VARPIAAQGVSQMADRADVSGGARGTASEPAIGDEPRQFARDMIVAVLALVFSILFIWYSRNTGHSTWEYWAPYLLAAVALLLGIVPADGRLLRAATLEIAESTLTGESLPVSKSTDPVEGANTPLGDRTDMVYMNTNVTRGAGEFVVTATGMATEVGHISGLLQAEEAAKTPLTRQLDRLTRQILWIAGAALIVSVVLNLARGDTFTTVFTAAIAFAVGALPENLPAVVTTILAYGTQALARAGAIMKRMQSTETLGSTSAINSDKTGTLTLNQMTVVAMAVVGRRYAIEGQGHVTDGQITRVAGQT